MGDTPLRPAGFWLRAGAYVIDGCIILLGQAAVQALAMAGLPVPLAAALLLAVPAAYFTWMPVRFAGQTLGKRAAGLAVARSDGSPLTYGRAFGRWAGYLLSAAPLGLGFAMAAFTREKKALHDMAADTRVRSVEELSARRKAVVTAAGVIPTILFVLGMISSLTAPGLSRLDRTGGRDTPANLAMLRTAASLFFGDSDGDYPPHLQALAPQYLQELPPAATGRHPASVEVSLYGAEACSGSEEPGGEVRPDRLRDTGGWGYVSDPEATCWGHIFVDCTHKDAQGRPWHDH